MPKKRTSMTNIKEVLRLKYECNLSARKIASCTVVQPSQKYCPAFRQPCIRLIAQQNLFCHHLNNETIGINTKKPPQLIGEARF